MAQQPDYKYVNVVDAIIDDISDVSTLPIVTGAESNTYQVFPSNSISPQQLTFNVQIPNTSTTINRKLMLKTKMVLKIDFPDAITDGTIIFNYGVSDCIQAFPFNSAISTIQANINNATVTVNSQQVLGPLLKLYNPRELEMYNSMTPSLCDGFYYNYSDAIGSNNNMLATYTTGSYDNAYIPRGAFPVIISSDPEGNTVLPYLIKATYNTAGAQTYPSSIYVSFTTCEPILFLSPFISGQSNSAAGLLGINNMQFTFNINSGAKCFSSGTKYVLGTGGAAKNVSTISNVQISSLEGSQLLFQFYTMPPQMYDKLSLKNVLNYHQYYPYTYQYSEPVLAKKTATIAFNNVQMSQIPTKIIICARKKLNNQKWYDSNSFLAIDAITMNFNNKSGLLASAQPQQLYEMSRKNGYHSNYYEFSGVGATGNLQTAGASTVSSVATSGSIIVIDPALDLSLGPAYTDSSTGQYNCQFNVTVRNQTNESIDVEVVMIAIYSGLFSTDNGTSSYQTGFITQEAVLNTRAKKSILDSESYQKIVGGAIENINSIHKHISRYFKNHSDHERDLEKPEEENGSAMSGSSMSGGKIVKLRKRIHQFTK